MAALLDPDPVAVFNFEDGSYEFNIEEPGYYSISILGAGFIREKQPTSITLISNKGEEVEVKTQTLSPRFSKQGKIGIERWGFVTEDTGRFTIFFSKLNDVVAKESMLASKRFLESPVKHDKLKIIIYKNITPVRRLLYIVSIVLVFIFLSAAIAIWTISNQSR